MTSTPPPLPPKNKLASKILSPNSPPVGTPPTAAQSGQNGSPSSNWQENWFIYLLAAFLLLLAIVLLVLAVRVQTVRIGSTDSTQASETEEVQEANISSKSTDNGIGVGPPAVSEETTNQPSNSEVGSRQGADSQSVEEVELQPEDGAETEPKSIKESVDGQSEAFEILEDTSQLPTIPIFKGNQGQKAGSIVTSEGLNPFLASLEAESIVFVIDRSSSMSQNRLSRVITAVNQTIDSLKLEQKFLVIFFSDGYEMHPSLRHLVDSTQANKQIAKNWVSTIAAGGDTRPVDAVLYALKQNPKRIVLLSDGEFDPLDVTLITESNRNHTKPIRIDGIGLEENVMTLQELARLNHGIYYSAR